jgi:hypothetical protein
MANSLKEVPRSWAPSTEIRTADLGNATNLQIPGTNLAGSITNAQQGVPKLVVYQETVLFSQFTDGGGAAGTFDLSHSIPAGAVYARSTVHAITGFTGDTSATMTLGDGTDVDRYNTGTPSLFTTAAAGVDLGAPSGTLWHTAAKTPVLTVTSGSDWGLVVAGAVTVTLFYYRPV